MASGDVAGSELLRVFRESKQRRLRGDIILIWGDMKYRGCLDELIALLQEHDRFWGAQDLEPGWWGRDVGSERTEERRDKYGEVYHAVSTLGRIGDVQRARRSRPPGAAGRSPSITRRSSRRVTSRSRRSGVSDEGS